VLWIRIRNYWPDPNPKKSSDSDSNPDNPIKWKYVRKIIGLALRREQNVPVPCFSIAKLFFWCYRFRNTYERNESHSVQKCHIKILVLQSESEKAKKHFWIWIRKKWIRIHNTAAGFPGHPYIVDYMYVTYRCSEVKVRHALFSILHRVYRRGGGDRMSTNLTL
jgi:hypothetical protein